VQNDGKIRIAFIITKLELGGAQRQLLGIIEGINKDKFSVFLYTAGNGMLIKDALKVKGLALRRSPFLERPISLLKDFFVFLDICFFLKNNRIDILHSHSSKAGILGRLAAFCCGTKSVLHTVHGWSFNSRQSFLRRSLFIFLEKLAADFTDIFVVLSDPDREKGLTHKIGRGENYRVIRPSVDFLSFSLPSRPGIREEFLVDSSTVLVATVSCLKPQKCPEDFVKVAHLAFRSGLKAKFVLVGDGRLRPRVEKLISRLGLDNFVLMLGWRTDIPKILSGIDIFLLTSLWEGLPVSVLEAMAAGKPVIATDTGGVRDVIVDGVNGYLVSPHGVNLMHNRLSALIKDPILRNSLGEAAGRSLNSDFSLNSALQKHEAIYEDLFKKSNYD